MSASGMVEKELVAVLKQKTKVNFFVQPQKRSHVYLYVILLENYQIFQQEYEDFIVFFLEKPDKYDIFT